MKTLFRSTGTLHWLEDAKGDSIPERSVLAHPVTAHVKYELRPSPQQPLFVDLYARGLMGFGQTRHRLELDNGIVLTGRIVGGALGGRANESVQKVKMIDVEESTIQIDQDSGDSSPQIDAAVFPVISSDPLGSGSCINGWARPGLPFSFVESLPQHDELKGTWSASALRLRHGELEISVVPSSMYWKRLVDRTSLHHDSIIGIRRCDGGILSWRELNVVTSLLSYFIGWLNHCTSPIFHIKAYRRGRLVYRGYKVHPHATVHRSGSSWLPRLALEDAEGSIGTHPETVEHALTVFAKAWDTNASNNGTLHIALQLLRSQERGTRGADPSLLYLRDAFGAISIIVGMLVGPNPGRGRHQTIRESLAQVKVLDRLPLKNWRAELATNHKDLWRAANQGRRVQQREVQNATLSRPLANVENWLLHVDDPKNAGYLLTLPGPVQWYILKVAIWLADLMVLKVIDYEGTYFNRLTGKTERVPWLK